MARGLQHALTLCAARSKCRRYMGCECGENRRTHPTQPSPHAGLPRPVGPPSANALRMHLIQGLFHNGPGRKLLGFRARFISRKCGRLSALCVQEVFVQSCRLTRSKTWQGADKCRIIPTLHTGRAGSHRFAGRSRSHPSVCVCSPNARSPALLAKLGRQLSNVAVMP